MRSALVYDLCQAKRALQTYDQAHPLRAHLVEAITEAKQALRAFDRRCPEQEGGSC